MFPPDSHVHTEWSYDAAAGSMHASCERALELGIPAIAFTEHVDHTVWTLAAEGPDLDGHLMGFVENGQFKPPAFDATGYLAAIDECRARYPELRILSGLELGEPHWHAESVAAVLVTGTFDRILGSQHCLPDRDGYAEPTSLYGHRQAAEVLRIYLEEVAELVASDQPFEVLAHIDYPVRSWPASAGPFDPLDFEAEFRNTLKIAAESGRALELNTKVPLHALILDWWHDEGGAAISFGSDAHHPGAIARSFRDAQQLAEACGFRPSANPFDLWARVG